MEIQIQQKKERYRRNDEKDKRENTESNRQQENKI